MQNVLQKSFITDIYWVLKLSARQCDYFDLLNLTAMKFCTANMLQGDSMPIQSLITQWIWNYYWRESSCGKRKRTSQIVGLKNVSRNRRERCLCTFSLFQLVLHLLGFNICWFYPWLFVKLFPTYFLLLFVRASLTNLEIK